MLQAALEHWFRSEKEPTELSEDRVAFHSDIRAIRPDAWSTEAPAARGREVEQAMWLAGVTTRDFAESIGVVLSPDRVTPSDDIIALCKRRAEACRERANELASGLPAPNPYGRPPLPQNLRVERAVRELCGAADAWTSLAHSLLNNRWPE